MGGVVPTGMFTLPGFLDIGNAELAIPCERPLLPCACSRASLTSSRMCVDQADYVFLTGGSATAAAGK